MPGCGRKIGPYDCCTIVTGDARELAPAIPGESVGLIFTDPVYDRIEDYRWLAETAARVLNDSGSVIAQTGTIRRYEAETAMRTSGLNVGNLLAEICTGGGYQMWATRSIIGWKPYLWFYKGIRGNGWLHDCARGGGIDKQIHHWGDSSQCFAFWISQLCTDGLILDPFCGGGTVPAVCKMLGRHYLAFEIDPETAERARERVRNTQPPLFVLEPEQLEFG